MTGTYHARARATTTGRAASALALALALFCLAGCSGSSGPRATVAALTAALPPVTLPVEHTITGDYDPDDYLDRSRAGGDADDDDIRGARDRDNDTDGSRGRQYDADDRTVLEFGQAPRALERRALLAVFARFYKAATQKNGAAVCAITQASVAGSVAETLGRPPGGPPYLAGDSCAVVLTKVLTVNRRQLAAYAAGLSVRAVRVDARKALIVFTAGHLPLREIHLVREAQRWKLERLLDEEMP